MMCSCFWLLSVFVFFFFFFFSSRRRHTRWPRDWSSDVCSSDLGRRIGGHFHNTRNTGFASSWAAFEAGATVLDASVGGLGGCPFAPRATGNVATEDLVYLLGREGVQTGIDLDALIRVTEWLERLLGRQLPGQLYRAGVFPGARAATPAAASP